MRTFRLLAGVALVAVLVAVVGVAPAGAAVTPGFSATNVTTCGGTSTVTVQIAAQNPPPVQQAADIALVVDDSGSIGTSVFNGQVRPSLEQFVADATPSVPGNHIGLVEFSTGIDFQGGLFTAPTTLDNVITSLHYVGGYTHTLDALHAADDLLTSGTAARSTAPKVIVIETDGVWLPASQNPTTYAQQLVANGVKIFAVGVGSGVNPNDLLAIAGGDPQHVFPITDYSGLTAALDQALLQASPAATNLSYAVTAAPGWQITGATASQGSVSSDASSVNWSLATLDSPDPSTVTITYTEQHVATTDGTAVPLASAATLAYTDPSGTAQSVDYSGQTVSVSGCNQPPVANAGPDQSVALDGSHTASVQLDGSGSSDPNGDALTYTWSENGTQIATGATPTVSLPIGQHTIQLAVSDGEFVRTDDVVITVYDPTPPVVTAAVSGTQHNGWYTSNAVVSFSVVDLESDITAESPDCAGATVSADTTGTTFSCSATSAGGTSTPVSVTVKRDATPPTIVFGGNQGTYGVADTVAITCTASDATSGLATSADCGGVDGPAWSFGAGTHTVTRTATDNAGNVGTGSTHFTVDVTAAGLCTLAKRWSNNAGVAGSLCAKLRHGQLRAFRNELSAQRGKHVPAAKADVLIALSRSL